MVSTFLAATAKGYKYAAEHPKEAAGVALTEIKADASDGGAAEVELDEGLFEESMQMLSKVRAAVAPTVSL